MMYQERGCHLVSDEELSHRIEELQNMSDQPTPVTVREMLAGIVEGDVLEMREVAYRAVAEDAGIRFGRLVVDFHEVE